MKKYVVYYENPFGKEYVFTGTEKQCNAYFDKHNGFFEDSGSELFISTTLWYEANGGL